MIPWKARRSPAVVERRPNKNRPPPAKIVLQRGESVLTYGVASSDSVKHGFSRIVKADEGLNDASPFATAIAIGKHAWSEKSRHAKGWASVPKPAGSAKPPGPILGDPVARPEHELTDSDRLTKSDRQTNCQRKARSSAGQVCLKDTCGFRIELVVIPDSSFYSAARQLGSVGLFPLRLSPVAATTVATQKEIDPNSFGRDARRNACIHSKPTCTTANGLATGMASSV